MSKLSPAARAIYDAFNRIGLYNQPSFETDRKALAAALRAVADQGEILFDAYDSPVQAITVEDLSTLAKELEAL